MFGNDDKQQTKNTHVQFLSSLSLFFSLSLSCARVSQKRVLLLRENSATRMHPASDFAWTCSAKQSRDGKTAVFVITVLQQLDPTPNEVGAVILCHTRELAYQISHE